MINFKLSKIFILSICILGIAKLEQARQTGHTSYFKYICHLPLYINNSIISNIIKIIKIIITCTRIINKRLSDFV